MDQDDRTDMVQKTHPGFIVVCGDCDSTDVEVHISVGFSETSGTWGSVDLHCLDCDKRTEIFRP